MAVCFPIAVGTFRTAGGVDKPVTFSKLWEFCGRILWPVIWKHLQWNPIPCKYRLESEDYLMWCLIIKLRYSNMFRKIIHYKQISWKDHYPSSAMVMWVVLMVLRVLIELAQHFVQFSTRSASCLPNLGHQTEFLGHSVHLEMPRWPVCSVSRMSERSGGGIMILLPCIKSSFCMVISPVTEKYGLSTQDISLLFGQPCLQYSANCWQISSFLWHSFIWYMHLSDVGKFW